MPLEKKRGWPTKSVVPTVAEVVAGSPALMAGEQLVNATEVVLTKGEVVVVRLAPPLLYPVTVLSKRLYAAVTVAVPLLTNVLIPPLPNSTQLVRLRLIIPFTSWLLYIAPPWVAVLP